MGDCSIKVALRMRPKLKREKDMAVKWMIDGNTIFLLDDPSKSECHSYDYILGSEQTNEDVFELIKPIVRSAVDGINGTIIAYGQTSSGKTHSIMGNSADLGIIQRAINAIFTLIEASSHRKFLIRASYLEIYNERLTDLLSSETHRKDLKIREDVNGRVWVESNEKVAPTREDLLDVIVQGNKNRRIGQTNMNEHSSRSHVVFNIVIESSGVGDDQDDMPVKMSQLYIVDLAGSERISQTGATGIRLSEGVHINKSLSCLALVIKQLSEGTEHINYRDSKLTRYLSNALGGNSCTLIIATITPVSVEDSVSTLKFASFARKVKLTPRVNEVLTDAALIKRNNAEVQRLREDLLIEIKKNTELQQIQNRKELLITQLEMRLQSIDGLYIKPTVRETSRRYTTGSLSVAEVPPSFVTTRKLTPVLEEEESPNSSVYEDGTSSSQSTPKSVLKLRLTALHESHVELKEYNQLERDVVIEDLQNRMSTMEYESNKKLSKVEEEKKHLETLYSELEIIKDNISRKFANRENELMQLLNDKDKSIEILQKKNNPSPYETSSLISEYNEKIEALTIKQITNENQIQSLLRENENVKGLHQNDKSIIRALELKIVDLEEALSLQKNELASSADRLSAVVHDREMLAKELDHMKKDNADLFGMLADKSRKVSQKHEEIHSLSSVSRKSEIKSRKSHIPLRTENKENVLPQIQRKIEHVEQSGGEERTTSEKNKFELLKASHENLEVQNQALTTNLEEKTEIIRILEEKLSSKESEMKDLVVELDKKQINIIEETDKLQEENDLLEQYEKLKTAATEKGITGIEHVEELRKDIDRLMVENFELNKTIRENEEVFKKLSSEAEQKSLIIIENLEVEKGEMLQAMDSQIVLLQKQAWQQSDETREKIENLLKQNVAILADLSEKDIIIKTLNANLEEHVNIKQVMDQRILTIQAELTEARKKVENVLEQNSVFQADLNEKNLVVETLHASLEEYKNVKQVLESRIETIKKEADDAQIITNTRQDHLDEATRVVQDLNENLQNKDIQIEQLRFELKKVNKDLLQKLGDVEMERSHIKNKTADLSKYVEELQKELSEKSDRVFQLEQDSESLTDLKAVVFEATNELKYVKSEFEGLEKGMIDFRVESEKIKENMYASVTKLTVELNVLTELLNNSETEKSEIMEILLKERIEMREQLDFLNDDNLTLQGSIRQKDSLLETLHTEVDQLKTKLKSAQEIILQNVADFSGQKHTEEVASLNSKLSSLQLIVNGKNIKIGKISTELKALNTVICEEKQENFALTNDLRQKCEENENLQHTVKQLQDCRDELLSNVHSLNIEITSLREELKHYSSKIKNKGSWELSQALIENRNLKEREKALRKLIFDKDSELERLQIDKDSELERLQISVFELTNLKESYECHLSDLEAKVRSFQSKKTVLDEEIFHMNAEMSSLKRENTEFKVLEKNQLALIELIRKQKAEKEEMIRVMENTLRDLNAKVMILEETILTKKTEIKGASDRLVAMELKYFEFAQSVKEQLAEKEREIELMGGKIHDLTAKKIALEKTISDKDIEIKDLAKRQKVHLSLLQSQEAEAKVKENYIQDLTSQKMVLKEATTVKADEIKDLLKRLDDVEKNHLTLVQSIKKQVLEKEEEATAKEKHLLRSIRKLEILKNNLESKLNNAVKKIASKEHEIYAVTVQKCAAELEAKEQQEQLAKSQMVEVKEEGKIEQLATGGDGFGDSLKAQILQFDSSKMESTLETSEQWHQRSIRKDFQADVKERRRASLDMRRGITNESESIEGHNLLKYIIATERSHMQFFMRTELTLQLIQLVSQKKHATCRVCQKVESITTTLQEQMESFDNEEAKSVVLNSSKFLKKYVTKLRKMRSALEASSEASIKALLDDFDEEIATTTKQIGILEKLKRSTSEIIQKYMVAIRTTLNELSVITPDLGKPKCNYCTSMQTLCQLLSNLHLYMQEFKEIYSTKVDKTNVVKIDGLLSNTMLATNRKDFIKSFTSEYKQLEYKYATVKDVCNKRLVKLNLFADVLKKEGYEVGDLFASTELIKRLPNN